MMDLRGVGGVLTTCPTIAHDWTVLPLNCVVKEDLSKAGRIDSHEGLGISHLSPWHAKMQAQR